MRLKKIKDISGPCPSNALVRVQ